MTSIKQELFKFTNATLVLIVGSITAATSHWFAHTLQDFRFTLLGFLIATMSGIYYGLKVPDRTKEKAITQLKNQTVSKNPQSA